MFNKLQKLEQLQDLDRLMLTYRKQVSAGEMKILCSMKVVCQGFIIFLLLLQADGDF